MNLRKPLQTATMALIVLSILAGCGAPASPALDEAPPGAESQAPDLAGETEPVPNTGATDAATAAEVEPMVFTEAPCCTGVPLEAGVYRSPDWYPIPFMVTVSDEWRSIVEEEFKAILLVRGLSDQERAQQWIHFIPIPGDMQPDSVWESLRSTRGLLPDEDTDISVGGLPGKQFEAEPETKNRSLDSVVEIPVLTKILFPGTIYHFETERLDVRLRFIWIPVAGQNMLIYMEAPKAEFEAFSAKVDRLLQTIQWSQSP